MEINDVRISGVTYHFRVFEDCVKVVDGNTNIEFYLFKEAYTALKRIEVSEFTYRLFFTFFLFRRKFKNKFKLAFRQFIYNRDLLDYFDDAYFKKNVFELMRQALRDDEYHYESTEARPEPFGIEIADEYTLMGEHNKCSCSLSDDRYFLKDGRVVTPDSFLEEIKQTDPELYKWYKISSSGKDTAKVSMNGDCFAKILKRVAERDSKLKRVKPCYFATS